MVPSQQNVQSRLKHDHIQQRKMMQKKKNFNPHKKRKGDREQRRGPRLPSSLRRELHLPNPQLHNDVEDVNMEADTDHRPPLPSDIYEYEENQAPEESQKNRRFDDVDRLEYELPSEFEDEEIDEGAADGEDVGSKKNRRHQRESQLVSGRRDQLKDVSSDEDQNGSGDELDSLDDDTSVDEVEDHESEDYGDSEGEQLQVKEDRGTGIKHEESDDETDDDHDNEESHRRMIEAVRNSARKKVQQGKRYQHMELVSEAYPESEFNINPLMDGNKTQQITLDDLMTPLQNTTGFGSLRKRIQQLEKKGVVAEVPLPKVLQDRLNRKAGYEKSSEEISKWQDIVKKNREAHTLVFTQRPDLSAVSTAELVAKFEPSTELEKEIASLLQETGLADGITEAGNALGFNKLTMGEVKARQERLAKMRSVLSYHEAKAKRVKKIKSKTFHRLLQKSHKSKADVEDELDPEAMKDAAIRAEFKRAQERMTLKHKNTSKWAKRIIKRGLKAKEDGSREALAEQLRTHTTLTRKMHAVDNGSSSDESSDDKDLESGEETANGKLLVKPSTKVLAKAKVQTLKVLEGDAEAEIPSSGLFALPFMARAIEKKRKQAQNEAMAVLEQLEQLKHGGDENGDLTFQEEEEGAEAVPVGRIGFGEMAKPTSNGKEEEPDMLVEEGSSSDEANNCVHEAPLSVASQKRKSCSNVMVDRICNGAASQAHKLQRTEGAWSNGALGKAGVGTALDEEELQATEAGSLLEDSEAVGLEARPTNPWLFGAANGNNAYDDGSRVGAVLSFEEKRGPLITSASGDVVTVAGALTKSDQTGKVVLPDGGISGEPSTLHTTNRQSLSSSESEEDDDDGEAAVEQSFQLSGKNVSQAELIERAFAGDNVEAEFEQMKDHALSEEVPRGEAALSLPGWGQWTDVQRKKGRPSWLVKQEEELQRRRDQALGKRRDAKLKYVVISERMDKRAEKFMAPSLPFPYKSRDVFEKSIRMPLGREYNTDQGYRDNIRPAIVKDAGVIINPIEYKMSTNTNSTLEPPSVKEKRASGPPQKKKR